jgi:hypothetical protein
MIYETLLQEYRHHCTNSYELECLVEMDMNTIPWEELHARYDQL